MTMLSPNLSVKLCQPRCTCILDPTLALSLYGLLLAKQLGTVVDLWLGRECWHIINDPTLYLQKPELLALDRLIIGESNDWAHSSLQEIVRSLRQWERFCAATDLTRLNLFWLGDRPSESLLPPTRTIDLFWHWEAIASSLDRKLARSQAKQNILLFAFRDTISLAVSLGFAFILTYQTQDNFDKGYAPDICQVLSHIGIPCQFLPPKDPKVTIERHYFHQLLICTNTAKVVWAGVHLAVLHLLAPTAPGIVEAFPNSSLSNSSSEVGESIDDRRSLNSFWSGVRGFWYLI